MKKIYTLLSITLMSCLTSFGQPAGTMAPPSFSTCTPALLQNGGDPTRNLFGKDNQYPTYSTTVQMFEIPSNANFNIVGAVVWIGYLKVNGTPGNVTFSVYDFCGWIGMNWASKQAGFIIGNQDCPGDIVGNSKIVSTSALHASTCLDNANIIVFDTPIPINTSSGNTCTMNKIGLGFNLSALGDDDIGMYSTGMNEGQYKELAWQYENVAQGYWYTILAETNGQVNADIFIFPIIDMNAYNASAKTNVCAGAGGITEQEAFFNGMKLSQSYPNPSKDNALINYETEKNSTITLIENKEMLEGGVTTKKISTASFSSGSYLLQITNGNLEKTQKQFVIR